MMCCSMCVCNSSLTAALRIVLIAFAGRGRPRRFDTVAVISLSYISLIDTAAFAMQRGAHMEQPLVNLRVTSCASELIQMYARVFHVVGGLLLDLDWFLFQYTPDMICQAGLVSVMKKPWDRTLNIKILRGSGVVCKIVRS